MSQATASKTINLAQLDAELGGASTATIYCGGQEGAAIMEVRAV